MHIYTGGISIKAIKYSQVRLQTPIRQIHALNQWYHIAVSRKARKEEENTKLKQMEKSYITTLAPHHPQTSDKATKHRASVVAVHQNPPVPVPEPVLEPIASPYGSFSETY